MDSIEIRSKTRKFLNDYLDGFDEFTDNDNLIDMGIVTNEFIFLLRQFIEDEFHITITVDDGEYFRRKKLSINSIGKLVEEKKKIKQINDLIMDMIKDSRIDVQNGMEELNSMTYMNKNKGGDCIRNR